MDRLKLAMVGCGAITKNVHLPIAARSDQVEVTALVDKILPRARELADECSVPALVTDNYLDVIGNADAAVIALPHYLHAPVTIDLVRQGIHVLVEKPMALNVGDCDKMIEAADKVGAVLAVGLDCRFMASSQYVKRLLEVGLLGDNVSFDLRQGTIFSWPVASDFMFRKEAAGGGVLIDLGIHALDLLLWWLGDVESVEYYDDAMGGVEADCELLLRLRCGASGVIEFSRTRRLRNSWVIRGERASLEVGLSADPVIRLGVGDQASVLAGHIVWSDTAKTTAQDAFSLQLEDFVDAVRNLRQPFVSGEDGKRAVELIEICYASRRPLELPWMFPEMSQRSSLEGMSQ